MNKINSYTKTGTKSQVALPNEIKSGELNKPLLLQAIHVYRSRKHLGNSKVQTRAEVSLTKAKVYRQKGTGNARHGAKSAPIFVGGGAAHGPKGLKRVLSLPAKMRKKALQSAILAMVEKGNVSIADFSGLKKTQDAQKIVDKIKAGENLSRGHITVVLSDKNKNSKLAFSNIGELKVQEYKNLNAYTAYFAGKLVFDKSIFETKEK